MSYHVLDERLMEEELNSKVFKTDPIKKILEPNRNRTDRFNNNYLMELKCRYQSVDLIKSWGGATIEKDNYYALTQSWGDTNTGYVNKFQWGRY